MKKSIFTIYLKAFIIIALAGINSKPINGQIMVKDINISNANSKISQLVDANGILYFTADGVNHGIGLWKSDGSSAGTSLVKDMNSTNANDFPRLMCTMNRTVYFIFKNELWKSDGSETGTIMLKSFSNINFSNYNLNAIIIGETLYFSADDGIHGDELWKSNGTAEGTVLVKDIHRSILEGTSSLCGFFTNISGTLYFSATDTTSGTELWKSDGTEAGTLMVKDICSGSNGSVLSRLTKVNDTLYFTADDGLHGYRIWKTNGTADGTIMLTDAVYNADHLTDVSGALFFSLSEGQNHACELWKSDGTTNGTVMVKNINPGTSGTDGSIFMNLCNVSGTLYFQLYALIANSAELWKSDGTSDGTILVKGVSSGAFANLINFNGTLFFTNDDGIHGTELWKSDGTVEGTVLVKDINPNQPGSSPGNFAVSGNSLFFSADDGTHGTELWKQQSTVNILSAVPLNNYCAGTSIAVTYTLSGGTPPAANNFTAQLSNASGSFIDPINMGTLQGPALSGTINAILPASTPLGAGYRIRVVCDQLAANAHDNETNININPIPIIDAGPDQFICISGGTTASMSINGSGLTSCTWLPEAGLSSATDISVSANPSITTSYTVNAANAAGCIASDEITVNIVSSITAKAGDDITVCAGKGITLMGNGGLTYAWAPTFGLSNTTGFATILNRSAGVYSYSLTAMSGSCSATDDIKVTFLSGPLVSILGNLSVCSGSSSVLTGIGAASYVWQPSNLISSIINVSASGTFTLTAADSYHCITTSTVYISEIALPTITISGSTTICNGNLVELTAHGAEQYIWNYNNGTHSQTLADRPSLTRTYTVTGIGNGCENIKTITVEVVNCSNGISESIINSNLKVFPNPSTGNLRISFKVNDPADFIIHIKDIMGREVFKEVRNAYTGQYEYDFNLNGLRKGMYFVLLKIQDETMGLKVIFE